MAWIRSLLAAAPCLVTPLVAASDMVTCPQKYAQGPKVGYLESANVVEVSPDRRTSLMSRLDRWEWELGVEQQNARESKGSLHLVCRYRGISATVMLKIPYAATFCKVEDTKTGTYAGCRPVPAYRRKNQI